MFNKLSNKELVSVTHDVAKTLSADAKFLDVAKLLAESATRLDVALTRGNELLRKAEEAEALMLAMRDDSLESRSKLELVVAENAVLKSERTEMSAIGELIRNQDNRITDQPFFAVMTKREIVGSEDHDYDRICWVENQSGDYVEATETQHRRLEAIYQGRYDIREGWDRYAMKEIDVFVTGCFTEQGCKDYISRNGHNLKKPFIFAFGSYRNNEYQKVRKFIMEMPDTPATDAMLNEIRAEGVELFAANQIRVAEHHEADNRLVWGEERRISADQAESFANQLRDCAAKDGEG